MSKPPSDAQIDDAISGTRVDVAPLPLKESSRTDVFPCPRDGVTAERDSTLPLPGGHDGPDFEDGPEFEGWAERSGQPLSGEQSWQEKYHDLILQVGNKYPGETRHETAKRYLIEREAQVHGPASEKLGGEQS